MPEINTDFCSLEILPFTGWQVVCSVGSVSHVPVAKVILTIKTKDDQEIKLKLCEEHIKEIASVIDTTDKYVNSVREKLRSRSLVGVKKYGVTLDNQNLTTKEWLTHLQEELLDASNYVETLLDRYIV